MHSFLSAKPIASGRFGTVYKATTQDGRVVAVKKLPLTRHDVSTVDNLSMIHREYENWSKVSGSTHIVKLHNFLIDESEGVALFESEYCTSGSLQQFLIDTGKHTEFAKDIIRNVLIGVKSCHDHDIAHCDIKPANILLADDHKWKVTDFGCSQHVTSSTYGLFARKGTPMFIAPEIFKVGQSYGKAVDLWAIGVLAFFLFYKGQYPFLYLDNRQYIETVIKGDISWPEHATKEEKEFITRFLTVDPNNRITCDEALQHNFLL